jgi:capsular polysaccharide biosynthesis protein
VLGRLATRLRGGPQAARDRDVAALLADRLADAPAPLVGCHPPLSPSSAAALRTALPAAEVVELPVDPTERHLAMTGRGRFDAVVDVGPGDGLDDRFQDTFWHLAPGRPYVVPGGAREVGSTPGPLGTLLAEAAAEPDEPLRDRRRQSRQRTRLAVRNHVEAQVVGDHLVLTHDLPDVLAKVREADCDAFLRAGAASRHRVLEVIPAEAPPADPPFREGPNQRVRRIDRPIRRSALSLRDYRDVVVAPQQLVVDGRVLLPDSYRHNQSPMPRHNALADVAPRFAVPRTPIAADLPVLAGTNVYLDNESRGHFGHVVTESLSRTWSWERALEIDPDARAIMSASWTWPELAEWEVELYAACGIPRERIVLVEVGRPVRVERLLSGTPMWSQPHYVHPRIRETWQRVGDRLAATATRTSGWPPRIFVSRRIAKRACVNGPELEAEFLDAGFEVVHPEDHSLGDQVALFRAAEVIAGYGGSGMFQTMFVPEPRHVIQVASEVYGPRNEYLIAAVQGHRLDSVVCRAEPYDDDRAMHAPYRYDPEREGPFLRQLLASLPPLGD